MKIAMAILDVVKRHLSQAGVPDKRAAWAERLETDAPTFSKLLNGQLKLTAARAEKWAHTLYPNEPTLQDEFTAQLMASTRVDGPTVAQFCDRVVAEMGAVPAERIIDLFTALCAENDPLVCVVYRDLPRAAPDAKFPGLGHDLAKAIAKGLNFAMFLPFGDDIPAAPSLGEFKSFADLKNSQIPVPVAPASRTTAFMQDIIEACRGAYL